MATGEGMDRRQLLWALGGLATGGLLLARPSPAEAADNEIPLAKVPAKIKKAADKAVPGAEWSVASKSTEDGETTYELEGSDAKDRYVYVEVADDGTVNEVQTEIKFEQVPAAVKKALKKAAPRFKVSTVYEVKEDGEVTRYDIEGKGPRAKKETSFSFTPDGKKVEDDDSE